MKNRKIFIMLIILALAIGFATVSTILYINGTSTIGVNTEDFDIYFSKTFLDKEDVTEDVISTDGRTINFTSKILEKKDDKVELKYEVTNNSKEYDATIEVSCNGLDSEIFEIVSNTPDVVEAKNKGTGSIEVALKHNVDKIESLQLSCNLKVLATGRTSVKEDPIEEGKMNKYKLTGYLKNSENEIINDALLVVYSEIPKYVEPDKTGYVYINELETGTHEMYYFENTTIEELGSKTKEEIKGRAITSTNFTTDSKKVEFPNGYKIDNLFINKEPNHKYEITLDPDGGNVDYTTKEVEENKAYGELPMPIKEGYNFLGWYLGEIRIKDTYLVAEPSTHTLKAKWEGKTYELSFDTQGGSSVTNMEITYDKEYGILPTSTLEGYTFKGWYTDTNYETKITNETIVKETENQRLYAKWEANEYDVNFETNGGSSVESIKVTYDSKYASLPTSIKTGYSLNWCIDEELQNCINNETIVKTSNNHTLYAKWTNNKYSLTYNTNGGKEDYEGKDITYNESYGELPSPTKDGYRFIGWYTSLSDGEKIESTTIVTTPEPVTLYAHWEANTYTVDFNANGGNTVTTVETVTYDTNYGFTMPTTSRNGYTFEGWYLGEEKIESTSTVSILSNTTLVAKWSLIEYTISYTLNSGTISNQPTTYNAESENITLPEPSKTGYTFTGWTGSNGETAQKTVTITKGSYGDKTYTANYTANQFTITYNGNGATGGTTSKTTCTYDQACTLANNGFTKTGNTFVSWTKDSTSGTAYNAGASFENMATSGNIDVYAKWNACQACSAGTGATCTMSVSNNTCTYSTSCQTGYGNISNSGKYNPSCTVNSYTVTLASATGGSWGSSSKSINYGGTTTVTITPSANYKLTSISCTNGYTATYTANSTSAQTVTIKNNSVLNGSTCTPTFVQTVNANIVRAYTYNASTCVTGTESGCQTTTCYLNSAAGSCPAGTIIDYKVNGSKTVRFHVMFDDGTTMRLQAQQNIASGVMYASGSNTSGPTTALSSLESATSGWSNVNSQTYTLGSTVLETNQYTGCSAYNSCATNKYTLASRTAKARLITIQETSKLGCTGSDKSCPIWMYNYTYNCSSSGCTQTSSSIGDKGYWTSSAISYSTTSAWGVRCSGCVSSNTVTNTYYGARPVVVINKT